MNPVTSTQTIPQAYLCSVSKQVMKYPVLGLCGHLFEEAVVKQTPICPKDNLSTREYIVLPQLKERIESFKVLKEKGAAKLEERTAPLSFKTSFAAMSVSREPVQSPVTPQLTVKPLYTLRNAHEDDVHGLIRLSDTSFVSGSKDTSIHMWNDKFEKERSLDMENLQRGYTHWITALVAFKGGFWASGNRHGTLTVWDKEGKNLSTIRHEMGRDAKDQFFCKDRNKTRINCITELDPAEGILLAGTAKCIQVWNMKEATLVKEYAASANDWVYCIEVLDNKNFLVVIGSDLEHWDMTSEEPQKSSLISKSHVRDRSGKRPHISAITRMLHNTSHFGAAFFDGTVKVIDVPSGKILKTCAEHRERVWAVANISPHVFASSADDKTIKIWDVRQEKSVKTIGGNPGRVSSLLLLNPTTLISASCPDKVYESQEKASLSFWDIRSF